MTSPLADIVEPFNGLHTLQVYGQCSVLTYAFRGAPAMHCNGDLYHNAVTGVKYPCARCEQRLGRVLDEYVGYFVFKSWREFLTDNERSSEDEARESAMLAGFTVGELHKKANELYGHIRRQAISAFDKKKEAEAEKLAKRESYTRQKSNARF